MSNPLKAIRAARGNSQTLSIAFLLLTVALSPRRPKTVAFGILFWFTAPGPMVPAGRAYTTFLSKMAITSV